MRFYVLVAFRNEPRLLSRCLQMLDAQDDEDFHVVIADDASEDSGVDAVLTNYLDREHFDNWTVLRNETRLRTLHNQVQAIRSVEMNPEDVIVFCDGDDRLARHDTLSTLRGYYTDDVDLTYGSYEPDPPSETCPSIELIPYDVCAKRGGYRQWARSHGTRWNHLRTFRRRIFDAIPESYFIHDGEWLTACPDHALMTPALELAGGRHRMIPETMLIYTSDRPDAEWRVDAEGIHRHYGWVIRQPALNPLQPLETT
jgi:glycosyltransferase involved in cell wall biosynthesis